jgi:hypothetical protein
MTGYGSVIYMLTNQAGRIRSTGGVEIEVTFSFYRYRETGFGVSGRKSAGGCCRVSDGSDVLTKIFEAGLPVMLASVDVEAEIRLTSPYSFQVARTVRERGNAARNQDGVDTTDVGANVIRMPSYRRTRAEGFRWERERKDGQTEFAIRQAFSSAALMRRFRSTE